MDTKVETPFWQNPENVMSAGQQSAALLQSPIYNVAYQMAIKALTEEWASTHPKESARRESLFHQLRGLTEMAQDFASYVKGAQDLMEAQAKKTDPRTKENEYLDNQGFGSIQ